MKYIITTFISLIAFLSVASAQSMVVNLTNTGSVSVYYNLYTLYDISKNAMVLSFNGTNVRDEVVGVIASGSTKTLNIEAPDVNTFYLLSSSIRAQYIFNLGLTSSRAISNNSRTQQIFFLIMNGILTSQIASSGNYIITLQEQGNIYNYSIDSNSIYWN